MRLIGEGNSSIIMAKAEGKKKINFSLITLNNTGSSKLVVDSLLFQMFNTDEKKASAISTEGTITDIAIRNSWFTQTNIALKGDFVTLSFIANTVELCKSGGIIAKGSDFRKIIISSNHFFANNNSHINLENSSEKNNFSNITISNNQFDQGLSSQYVKGYKSIGNAIELSNVSLFTIQNNNFNGLTPKRDNNNEEYQNGHAVKCFDCSKFLIDNNTYSFYSQSAINIENSNNFKIGGLISNIRSNGVDIKNSQTFKLDFIEDSAKIGGKISNSNNFDIKGSYTNNLEFGLLIENSSYGKIQASLMDNNLLNDSTKSEIYFSGKSNNNILDGANISNSTLNNAHSIIFEVSTFNNIIGSNTIFEKENFINKGNNNIIN